MTNRRPVVKLPGGLGLVSSVPSRTSPALHPAGLLSDVACGCNPL